MGKVALIATKFCGGCSSEQPLTNWTAKGTRCRTCVGEAAKRSYAKMKADPERVRHRNKSVSLKRKELKRQAVEYKGNKCTDCGNTYPDCVYDFHHLDPEAKDFSIAKKAWVSFDDIKQELDKCILLCANCHRIRHHD